MGHITGGITMRTGRSLVTTLLLASLGVVGCTARGGSATTAAPAASSPSTTTAAPTTASTPSTRAPVTAAPACAEQRSWGTDQRQLAPYSEAALYLVRAGQHDCYDRVVFDLNGPAAVGYSVRYVDVVREDGSGTPRPVAGTAALEVIVHAPAKGADNQGHQPGVFLAGPGQDFYTAAQLAGWRSLREVRYAGSFEGQTTIAVGVRARLPFRVLTLLDSQNQIMRVVLDVAHR
jgi:hypothetical protein